RNDRLQFVRSGAQYQLARALQGAKVGKVLLAEDLGTAGDKPLADFALAADADCFGEELVGAHSNQRSYHRKRHVVAGFREGVHPGLRMSVIAVYERAVDIED